MNKEDEIFKNFIVEMGERLQDLEDALGELEQAYQPDLINQLFRCIHTIKGGGSFFGLSTIQELSHEFEELLMKIREGELSFDKGMMPAFFSACDSLKDMHESDDFGQGLDVGEVCRELKKHLSGAPDEAVSQPAENTQPTPPEPDPAPSEPDSPSAAPSTSSLPPASAPAAPSPAAPSAEPSGPTPPTSAPSLQGKQQSQNETIRVKVDLLNKLM